MRKSLKGTRTCLEFRRNNTICQPQWGMRDSWLFCLVCVFDFDVQIARRVAMWLWRQDIGWISYHLHDRLARELECQKVKEGVSRGAMAVDF